MTDEDDIYILRSRGRPVKPALPAFLVIAVLGSGLMGWGEAGRTAKELSVPYRQEGVSILNGGITLAGTLARPEMGKPSPAQIIFSRPRLREVRPNTNGCAGNSFRDS